MWCRGAVICFSLFCGQGTCSGRNNWQLDSRCPVWIGNLRTRHWASWSKVLSFPTLSSLLTFLSTDSLAGIPYSRFCLPLCSLEALFIWSRAHIGQKCSPFGCISIGWGRLWGKAPGSNRWAASLPWRWTPGILNSDSVFFHHIQGHDLYAYFYYTSSSHFFMSF